MLVIAFPSQYPLPLHRKAFNIGEPGQLQRRWLYSALWQSDEEMWQSGL
jgi:hypothetical protein